MARIPGIDTKILWAGGVLASSVLALTCATELGEVDFGAGDMKIVLAKGETGGLQMDIAPRGCPPKCGIVLDWRPLKQ